MDGKHDVRLLSSAEIEDAVAAGIRRAVSDPELWDAAGAAMRMHAQSAAGGWFLGGMIAVLRKAAWVVVVVMGIYLIGGWGAVVAFLKANGAQ